MSADIIGGFIAQSKLLNLPEPWGLDSVPPPEPNHLLSLPSRVKVVCYIKTKLHRLLGLRRVAPTQTGEVLLASEPVQEKEYPVPEKEEQEEGFTEWRNASMGHAALRTRQQRVL